MFLYPSKSNRNGLCLFYREWLCPLKTLSPQQDHKLMFGLVFSVKSFTTKMDPADGGNLEFPQLPSQGCSFHSFRTNTYKLSFMESPSGIKNVCVSCNFLSLLIFIYIYNIAFVNWDLTTSFLYSHVNTFLNQI
ncbi:hypothetical protein AMTRI_Chr03g56680 [Amborella trichopoda]